MPELLTRADSLREYLTGAGSDGAAQTSPNLSLGNYRSASEAVSLGITIEQILSGTKVLFASGANPASGTLTAFSQNQLTWTPLGATQAGDPVTFGDGETKIVEAYNAPGQYLRVQGFLPFQGGLCKVITSSLVNNYYGFDNVSIADAASGINRYRASILRNEGSIALTLLKRWIATYGTMRLSNSTQLGASGAGTITTTSSFADWPKKGWCQVRTSGNTLREAIYYSSRTNTALTVPATGRALLGTTAAAGASSDKLYAVPGIALAVEPGGVQSFGSAIQTIANANTEPSGVTWNLEITAAAGLNIGTLHTEQIGIWIWEHIPIGIKAVPLTLTQTQTSFTAA